MKGKVLGFDAAAGTGAITGDDGKRYTFVAAANKSPTALKAGDSVDFQVEGDAAKDIYAVPGAASVDLAAMAANPAVANVLAKPNVIWAGVVILGSLIAGYLSAIQLIGGGPMGILGAAGFFYALLFLIPVAAGVLIFFEFTNHALTPTMRLATGVLAAVGPIVLPLIGNAMLPGMMGELVAMGGAGVSGILSVGSIITIAGGVLIILTERGIVKLPTKL
jgi:cold shock CspA family protein